MIKHSVIFLFLLLCFSCSDRQKDNRYVYVDFSQCLSNERPMKLSEIADTVEYLELKTPGDLIITRISEVIPIEDCWLVRSREGVVLFTGQGEFIRQIGRRGQGPGEYLQLRGLDYDPVRQEILIVDSQQILFYDLEGNYKRNIKIREDYFYNIARADTVLWTTGLGIHLEKHECYAFNQNGDTLAAFPNPYYGIQVKNTDGVYFSHSRLDKEFYRFGEELYLKNRPSYDTVFHLCGKQRIPHIIFEMGKYKLPVEYETWYCNADYERYASDYWGVSSVAEDERFLFLLSKRRYSTQPDSYDYIPEDWRYIVFDKEKGEGFSVKEGKQQWITDDILGGPSFWPRIVTDQYYIQTIEWYEILQDVKAGVYSLAPALQKQFDSFTPGTNELLVLCRRKNR